MGGIPWGRNPVWEESRLGGILWGRNPVGGIPCGRNPGGRNPMGGIPWEEFCMGGIPMEPKILYLDLNVTSRSKNFISRSECFVYCIDLKCYF